MRVYLKYSFINFINSIKAWFSKSDSSGSPVGCEEEEKLLKQAIALSLEGAADKSQEEDNNHQHA